MRQFDYVRPQSLQQASQLLWAHGERAALLAGGTDLIVQMDKGMRWPQVVIDLKHIRDVSDRIEETPSGLRVGTLVRLADLACHAAVAGRFPALAEAARAVGSAQIRNRATLGGNICNASPAADTATPLLVYGAIVNLAGIEGGRALGMESFFVGPGRTALAAGEIVESIDIPYPEQGAGSAFERVARRRAVDVASASVACLLSPSGRARFGFGAVGPTPILVEGRAPETAGMADEFVQPISDIRAGEDYRRAMVLALARRVLERAGARMTGGR